MKMMSTERQTSLGVNSLLSGEDLELFPDLIDLQDVVSQSRTGDCDISDGSLSPTDMNTLDCEDDFVSYLTGNQNDDVSEGQKSEDDEAPSVVIEYDQNVKKPIHTVVVHGNVGNKNNNIENRKVGTTYMVLKRNHSVRKDSESSEFSLNGKSMSRNAIAARENREKKKKYVNGLEKSVRSLTAENKELRTRLTTTKKSVESLQNEVRYLRGVLANQSTLSSLLKNIGQTADLTITSSECQKEATDNDQDGSERCLTRGKKRKSCALNENKLEGSITRQRKQEFPSPGHVKKVQKMDHCYASGDLQFGLDGDSEDIIVADNDPAPGVCLHVSGKKVSIEYCLECSQKASQG